MTTLLGAIKRKISINEAIDLAENAGWNFNKDYFAQATSSMNGDLVAIAKLRGYKKSPSASGSTARMFFEYLRKKK
jgi:hypothetical protein